MNMRDMDPMQRMELWVRLETATRLAHGIDALIEARNAWVAADNPSHLNRMIAARETNLRSKLAQIADMLGLALVDKAVVEEGADLG